MTLPVTSFAESELLRRLPTVRGKLTANESLADQTWFRVGGPAEVMFRPADEDDLAAFLAVCPRDVPVTVIGLASNLLVRDGGVRGVVIKLGPAFGAITTDGHALHVGGSAVDLNVARAAQAAGLAGLEFLSGIPGTIGGGLRMNAGSYGREFKDVVACARVVMRDGSRRTVTPDEIGFAYRHTDFAEDAIFVGTTLRGTPDDPAAIAERIKKIQADRTASQPIRERTGGSTFANPPGHKAWQLIDAAGGRGLRLGGAQMSEKHCNFLINTGAATATDIEQLGEEIRRRVRDQSGVELRWEIRRIGEPLSS